MSTSRTEGEKKWCALKRLHYRQMREQGRVGGKEKESEREREETEYAKTVPKANMGEIL